MIFKVLFFWVGRTAVRTWHVFQGRFLEGQFGCGKWFSIGCKCNLVADISFLELIKSLFGFLRIGVFPGWLPKFLSFTWICSCCSLCLFHCKSAWQCVFLLIIFYECGFIHFRVFR
jgi:hypothetical protein